MKKTLFYLSLLIIPILFFLFFEGLLTVLGYGQTHNLFYENRSHFILNPDYPKKYFSSKNIGTPQIIKQEIVKKKQPQTFRIICLGGSTTAGFPYEVNINFPVFIENYLKKQYPEYQTEVVNLGISAINSFSVLDMLPQIEKLQPDLILIYMGHNEYYGAFGSASTENVGQNRALILLAMKLKEWRIYQLVQNSLRSLSDLFENAASINPKPPKTLMQAMVGSDLIVPNSSLRTKTEENFRENLNEIITFWKKRGIPVLISALVSNLKDQPPIGKKNDASLKAETKQIDSLSITGNWQSARSRLKHLIKNYPENATLHFQMGRTLFALANYPEAKNHFKKAINFDTMPFRAPANINQIIKQTAGNLEIPFVSADSIFSAYSAHGIVGNLLFLEHLHPNQNGYKLLAAAFLNKILNSLNITQTVADIYDHMPANYTELDLAIAEQKIIQLISQPPFKDQTNFNRTEFEYPAIPRLASLHLHQDLYWDAAHLELGKWFLEHKLFDRAIREFECILVQDSTQTSASNYLGDVYFYQKNFKKALDTYERGLSHNKSAHYLQAKIGKTQIISGNNKAGIASLTSLIDLGSFSKIFIRDQKKEVFYLLALASAREKQYAEAREFVEQAIELDLNYSAARKLEKQLNNLNTAK